MGKSKKMCSSICEIISNRLVCQCLDQVLLSKTASWLLARALLEVSLFCKCSSFPLLDRGMYWALPDGPFPKQDPLGPKWIKLKEGEQSQQQEKVLAARSNLIWKQAQWKTGSFSQIIVQGKGIFPSFAGEYLLTIWLNNTLVIDSISHLRWDPRRILEKSWNPVLQDPVSSPTTTLDNSDDLGLLTSLCLSFQIK